MHLLLTGAGGTLGPHVSRAAQRHGFDVTAWDRSTVSPNEPAGVAALLAATSPDAIVHLAMGDPRWAADMAAYSGQNKIPFLFTSTVSVFADTPLGPFGIDSPRSALDEYGRYKIACEDAVQTASSEAMICRIGYQIDPGGGGNNMAAHLHEQALESGGSVRASTRWIPATSLMSDTAEALLALVASPAAGTHHLDSNAAEAWTYFDIARALRDLLGGTWSVEATQDRVADNRLAQSLPMPLLSARLPTLRERVGDR